MTLFEEEKAGEKGGDWLRLVTRPGVCIFCLTTAKGVCVTRGRT